MTLTTIARSAGRGGRAITFVSQYDIELVLAIEGVTGVKMVQLPGVDEEAVLAAMGKASLPRTDFDAAAHGLLISCDTTGDDSSADGEAPPG